MTAGEIVAALDLAPHPEGGWYRQTWEGVPGYDGRSVGTCIYYLLGRGERSHWHRIDAVEIWHFHAGDPLVLSVSAEDRGPARDHLLCPEPGADRGPQAIVPRGHWQAARSTGDWSLVGCTVSPGFRFDGFELGPADMHIPRG